MGCGDRLDGVSPPITFVLPHQFTCRIWIRAGEAAAFPGFYEPEGPGLGPVFKAALSGCSRQNQIS